MNKDKEISVKLGKEKDSPARSMLKAFTWRIMAAGATFLISFVVFARYTEKTIDESMENAGLIAGIEFIGKIFLYYIHERLWTNIRWGKYWSKEYWRQRAWRKLYKNKHKD
ncbi:MAG: DUF2061 domain-containing protein [Bacteroidetes bacterium]|nr:DUF2061 domain-containing protein [Bacteroidota bacterium]